MQVFEINADFTMSMGMFTEKDKDGKQIITDRLLGLEMKGEVIYNVNAQIDVQDGYVTKM